MYSQDVAASSRPGVELDKECAPEFLRIDHVAIAVLDLEASIVLFRDILGFELKRRLSIRGEKTGMISAELQKRDIRFVLCQGTESASQVSELVRMHGVGVAHIALEVDDVDLAVKSLKSRGMTFDTDVIRGHGLVQVFSARSVETGVSFEIIHREGEQEFVESNVQQLFDQLEKSGTY
jgi:methylmalonyl-CoA/ethylmalonyl-CoA epimerase